MENEQTTQTVEATETTQQQTAEGTNSGGSAPSFDDLLRSNPDYQAEFDRRMTKGLATARAKWEQSQAEEQDEAAKLARMTATQRERYQLDKDKAAFAQQQAQFAAQQMEVSVGAELQKRDLDASFARYLSGKTAEESKANIDKFEQVFRAAVQAGVKTALRGKGAPREAAQSGQSYADQLRRAAGLPIGK